MAEMEVTLSTDANKRLVQRFFHEMVVAGNFDNFDEIVHDDYVDYTQPPGWAVDRSGLRLQIEYLRFAFPDIHVDIFEVVGEGDVVVHRQMLSGTHLGEFFGIPPTGNQVEMAGFHLFRIRDGKLIEHRAANDELGMLRQLGAIPAGSEQVGA